jgi:hypothetical protein
MGTEEHVGLFEETLGFRTATGSFKAVHIMNDCAQTLVGGAPDHGGDLICRVIREHIAEEPNSETDLRTDKRLGTLFNRAFPQALGPRRVRELRAAAKLLLNFDGGVYAAGTRMASPLATHRGLLGSDGFRRFRLGPFLSNILPQAGRQRLKSLFESDRDPITRALRPLISDSPLVDTHPATGRPRVQSALDRALGERLGRLLSQPLSKPALLRAFALGASLGLVLKILGVGRGDGRPVLLAVPTEDGAEATRWEGATQAFQRARDSLDAFVARTMSEHSQRDTVLARTEPAGDAELKLSAVKVTGTGAGAFLDAVRQLRELGDQTKIYWPDDFAIAVGRRAGCVLPRTDRAGWGTFRLALTPELVEVLVLMSVDPSGRPQQWSRLWRDVREDLGVLIGASPTKDAEMLREVGVPHVSAGRLRDNALAMLRAAVRRGAARALPDGGAEAVGTLS